MLPAYPITRAWKRQSEDQGIGVDVIAPSCQVHIDIYEPRWSTFLVFSLEEWDEIVKAVAEKRRAILKRLGRTEDDAIGTSKASSA